MRAKLQNQIAEFAQSWCTAKGAPYLWRDPIVKLADANDPGFSRLARIVDEGHHLPYDFLPEANTVVSLFLPFIEELARGNRGGDMASQSWADAYNQTNAMAAELCEHLARWIQAQGWEASVVSDAGMISLENPRSRWSQRHVAYLAGQGTWGVNNMLISQAGCVGRYYSLVAKLPQEVVGDFDQPVTEERCHYKNDGTCLLCVKHCVNGALTADGFDRFKCLEQCLKVERERGADVCGKCIVGMPCSHL